MFRVRRELCVHMVVARENENESERTFCVRVCVCVCVREREREKPMYRLHCAAFVKVSKKCFVIERAHARLRKCE